MPLINTSDLKPGVVTPWHQQAYNALDCCITMEVFEELRKIAPNDTTAYDFERALQAPALEMMLRGFKVDETERRIGIQYLRANLAILRETLDEFANVIWDKGLNPKSPVQLKDFFYNHMHLPEVSIRQKGQTKLSMNREALEKLGSYFYAKPIISCILAIRDYSKELEVLESKVDSDGRIRTSYNIAGTETFRWSSSKSSEGSGANLQNIRIDPANPETSRHRSIRKIFIADAGMELLGIDLEQAESRELGFQCGLLFDDWTYLDACEGGDLHTTACQMIWPELEWTGDAKADRQIAERQFYREFTHRDMSKRGGHGINYLGTPFTMSQHLKVPIKFMQDFQARYFGAFPAIPKYHRWVAQQLQQYQRLTTPFGITRQFFGRPNDDTTLREAIAFIPQSSTATRLNLGLYRIWEWLNATEFGYLTAQVHDAVYLQYRPEARDEVVAKCLELINIPITAPNGRIFTVPGEAKIGWNFGNFNETTNPNGLKKYKLGTPDTRMRRVGLDRPL